MKVLCVDDETSILRALERVLQDHEVVSYNDACEAIDHLLTGEHYDAILCDMFMPHCSGVDLYRAMDEHRPDMCQRIIFLTGGSLMPGIDNFLDSVTCPRIDKPFQVEDLERALRRVVGRATIPG